MAACLLFALWFATGAVMVFVPFPSLPGAVRAARSEAVDLTRVTVTPAQALEAVPGAVALRLVSRGGRPVYVASVAKGRPRVVAADVVGEVEALGKDQALAIAKAFEGRPAKVASGPLDYDQWTVAQGMDPLRPFWRVRFEDGEDLYVSARTGEAAQRTGRAERGWNYLGAVIHWIYMTPLRRHWAAWDRTVWWVSLACVTVAAIGLVLGVVRSAQSLRRRLRWSPFRGWLQWHHLLGLFGGVLALTWIVSGWLSMDHGRLFSRGSVPDDVAARAVGIPLATSAARFSVADLQALAGASRIDFGALAGVPLAAATGTRGAVVLRRADGAVRLERLPEALIVKAVQSAWPGAVVRIQTTTRDDFYRLAEELPEDAVLALSQDGTRLYVDPTRGELMAQVDRSRAAYAWWYYALHTFKLPALVRNPALWAAAVCIPLAFGFAFSLTAVVVAWRALKAQAAR